MKFPVCDYTESVEGFYSQCAGCPIESRAPGCALDEQEDGTYLFDGPTPHGGVRAVFYFKDNAGNQVSKYDAVHVEIHELDESGMLVTILYGMVDPEGMIYLKKSLRSDDAE
ncbi:MAG: hypothetical protein K9I59_02140 [Chlorobium sp.]|jgi:hypothetical protein|uniref:hypothetical protein n=1 Tax=Chlorobium sp. TaxID=1095 RepID=UPI001E09D96A|nr:hypothetical protein [Chlorobium sp.]MBN1278171.1 hypothetical protein [Chlorobiaceae bacterium]MCF8215654.1 hypothetical protein [Chlorobium sp.]MCF8270709.1 hypothetical protein [Chlorobium sp.]MCF8286863.1 hypothetical protein [Chlorobium sp.]MCF8290561.1 hypothetical protein [Chlorobium sp.]